MSSGHWGSETEKDTERDISRKPVLWANKITTKGQKNNMKVHGNIKHFNVEVFIPQLDVKQ